jgi:N,N'-diacetyllegionaminate synthase
MIQNYFNKFNNCFFIAEIGVNHNGDLKLAKEMIDAAVESGADAVKFQTFKAELLVSKDTPKVKYQKRTTVSNESHFDMIRNLELSHEDHFILKDYCEKNNILFLSTPYDVESANFLHKCLDIKIFKTASADLIDQPLHEFIANTGKPSIISVGMATLGEIEETLRIYQEYQNLDIILLHCVSNYPCSHESLNLRVMNTLREAFNLPVGYSDHSIGLEAAVLSIALGAKIIEKHFTLDKKLPGPDHLASSLPHEFKQLCESVKIAEKALGSSVKECQPEESQMANVSRKSIVMRNSVKAGTLLSAENLTIKRPGNGLPPSFLKNLIGLKLSVDKKSDDLVSLKDIE